MFLPTSLRAAPRAHPLNLHESKSARRALKKGTAALGLSDTQEEPHTRDTSTRLGEQHAGKSKPARAAARFTGCRSVRTAFRRPAKVVYSTRVRMKRVRTDTC